MLRALRAGLSEAGGALRGLAALLLPAHCIVCGHRLSEQEHCVCTACSVALPYTRFRARRDNPVERILIGRFPLGRADSYIFYRQHSDAHRIISAIKYYGRSDAAVEMGRRMAAELEGTAFFRDIDLIIPIPLSPRRERRRGYNQSLMLARGVGEVTGIKVDGSLLRRRVDNPTQTRLNVNARIANVEGIFSAPKPAAVSGRHILIIDDVITTGATITSAADSLTAAGARLISVLTLAAATSIDRW
jgi:ComF family protein